MRLLTRYVLREIFLVFSVTLVSLTTLLILIGAVQTALQQGLGVAQIVQLLPYLVPNALVFAVPGTILFSVSTVYGRMSGANEVVALKSMGLSPMVILWPTLALSVVLSLTTVWLNDIAMSWGHHGVQRVVVDALEDIAYGMLRTQRSYSTSSFSVTVQRVVGRKLIKPNFALKGGDDSGPITIRAESAELHSNPGSGVLTIKLYNGIVDGPRIHAEFPDSYWERDIAINPQSSDKASSPAHMSIIDLPAAAAKQREVIRQLEDRMVAEAGIQMVTGDFDTLTSGAWAGDTANLSHQKFRLYRMETEPPRRWSNGFSCLCFALVGSTMAIRRRNSDALTSFFLCFLPILLVYYPFLFYGLDRAKAGAITPYAVWLANVVLVLWGLWLLRRVKRY